MEATTHPSKNEVRDFMQRRRGERTPPPSPAEVRRALGWNLTASFDPLRRDFPR